MSDIGAYEQSFAILQYTYAIFIIVTRNMQTTR